MPIEDYKRIIALLPEPTLILTGSGRLLGMNSPGARLLCVPKMATAVSLLEFLAEPSLVEEVKAYLQRCSRSKQPLVGGLTLSTTDGVKALTAKGAVIDPRSVEQEARVLLRLFPKDETNARFLALKNQMHDLNQEIAKRRRAEYEHHEQTRWLEVTLSSIGDAVITSDAQNCVTFMNPVAEVMTGWTQEDALGESLQTVFVVVNEYTGEPVENPALRALRDRVIVELANHSVLIGRSGSRVAIEDTAAPIVLEDEIRGAILVFHDVSARRLLEKQLMERAEHLELANRRKNEFLAMLAHELRSPLAPISNAVEIMRIQAEGPPALEEPQTVISRQVQHLKRLVDDMLDVSRITRGKMNIVPKYVDLSALVRISCSDFHPQFEEARICFSITAPPTKIWVHADRDRITQVLHNLLANAIKFTPSGGSASVSLSVEGDCAVLRVTDTGIGLNKSELPDLFEPFTQAAQNLDRSRGGLGLGLALVKGIVDLHQGRVNASSDGAYKGTTVTVWLPLTDREDEEPTEPSVEAASPEAHRILLIEDETDTANTMRDLLELLGQEVHLARTGPEGLKKAMAITPSLIICDIGLPGLDGFAIAERLRKSTTNATTPLVALTGYGNNEFVERTKRAGFDMHITKPASLQDLRNALKLKQKGS